MKTGAVSAQFHVVYDNHFSTVSSDRTADNVPVPPQFHDLYRFSRENHVDPDDLVERRRRRLFQIDRNYNSDSNTHQKVSLDRVSSREGARQNFDIRDQTPTRIESRDGTHHSQRSGDFVSSDPDSGSDKEVDRNNSIGKERTSSNNDTPPASSPSRTRSGRQYRAFHTFDMDSSYLSFVSHLGDRMDAHDAFLVESDLTSTSNYLTERFEAYSIYQRLNEDIDISTGVHPLAFSARANAEDTPRFHEAMKCTDREGFIAAMKAEMDQLSKLNAFVAVPREKPIAEGRSIIECTWAFKRKRFPDGSVKKLKARLCVRGDLQKNGVDYFDTYSPVVQWSTVRLLLIVSILLNLETKQVDFTLAFVQAKAEPGIYIEMPRMFEREGYVLELKRTLYGQCDAPLKFYEHLKKGLEQRGFTVSKYDPCLFKSSDIVILTYVDDCILFCREEKKIDTLIDDLRKEKLDGRKVKKFILEVEGNYAGFLGMNISEAQGIEDALELLQNGLIDRILTALNFDDEFSKERSEPASVKPLHKDENGPSRKEHWSYSSVVGMLLYLASNSRPNQCARFNHCPRLVHEQAVKRIAQYLKGTRHKGLILKPNDDMNLKLYADADFAGLWNVEDPLDPIRVRSRSGHVVTLCGLPVSWRSKLHTEISTSTMMAEYIALSTGMRELIPLIDLFDEICEVLKIHRSKETKIVRVFEDNEGALKLASKELPYVTPQSKHFAVKYHWFREYQCTSH